MIVHHPRRLHECVADRTTDELETPFLQIFAHAIGVGRTRGKLLQASPAILFRLTANEPPDVGIERSVLALHSQKDFGIRNGRPYLHPIANDAGILEELLDLSLLVPRNQIGVKAVEGETEIVALVQDRAPTQPCLKGIEDEELEEFPVIM
jgi:hypothetical protein